MRATREESLQPLKTFIYDNRVHKNINAVLKSGDPKGHYLDYIVDRVLELIDEGKCDTSPQADFSLVSSGSHVSCN